MQHFPPGYTFYPDADAFAIGYPRVDICLSGEPVERYFDAHEACFPVAGGSGLTELHITHPWVNLGVSGPQRVCAGRFHLYEMDGDPHYGFTLGGTLEVHVEEHLTRCTLSSSAPIINLQDDPDSPGVLLANEFEALLAKRHAAWGLDDDGYARRLENLEPARLFAACLRYLEEDLHSLPVRVRGQPRYQTLGRALRAAEQALENSQRRTGPALRLEEIL